MENFLNKESMYIYVMAIQCIHIIYRNEWVNDDDWIFARIGLTIQQLWVTRAMGFFLGNSVRMLFPFMQWKWKSVSVLNNGWPIVIQSPSWGYAHRISSSEVGVLITIYLLIGSANFCFWAPFLLNRQKELLDIFMKRQHLQSPHVSKSSPLRDTELLLCAQPSLYIYLCEPRLLLV